MRIIVFFDLPSITTSDLRSYRQFRKNLQKEGFIMMQESVYCKLLPNATAAATVRAKIARFCPSKGVVQVMTITEKQYASIEFFCGTSKEGVCDDTRRIVEL